MPDIRIALNDMIHFFREVTQDICKLTPAVRITESDLTGSGMRGVTGQCVTHDNRPGQPFLTRRQDVINPFPGMADVGFKQHDLLLTRQGGNQPGSIDAGSRACTCPAPVWLLR